MVNRNDSELRASILGCRPIGVGSAFSVQGQQCLVKLKAQAFKLVGFLLRGCGGAQHSPAKTSQAVPGMVHLYRSPGYYSGHLLDFEIKTHSRARTMHLHSLFLIYILHSALVAKNIRFFRFFSPRNTYPTNFRFRSVPTKKTSYVITR